MKITLLWSYYESYLSSFNANNPNMAIQPYEQQLQTILKDYFGWPPSLVQRLSEAGHDVQIVIVNAETLQRAWAEENKIPFTSNWKYDMPKEQVRQFQPDIIWIGPLFGYFGEYLRELKKNCKRIFAWTASPIPPIIDLDGIDCFLTSHLNFAEIFWKKGKNCELLLPTFEPRVLENLPKVERDVAVSFVGSLTAGQLHRIDLLRKLSRNLPLQVWSNRPRLLSRGLLNPKWMVSYFRALSIIKSGNGEVWGMDMYSVLARSKITINAHAEFASGLAGNMRMFEATGAGALLITEDAPNINDLYQANREVVVYKNYEELEEKITYYTHHDSERAAVARAGQQRTLTSHSTVTRAQELLAYFMKYM